MPDDLRTGLALSGGGYRAMLFSLGSLWRLNELGWLRKIDMITSVSGGSILNGVLATRWSKLTWSSREIDAVATNFAEEVAEPVRGLASKTIDVLAGVEGLLSVFSTISDKVTESYDQNLFNGATLQNGVPPFEKGKTPRFLFYATSLQTGSSVRMERKRLADYKIGEIQDPNLPVARVVAASSAFPPVLSPVELKLDPNEWRRLDGTYLFDQPEFKGKLLLTDGGVYDNMGLEAIWDRCDTVLVSDAGAPLELLPAPPVDWTRQAVRVLDIVTEQTRALRKRSLMQQYQQTHEGPIDAGGSTAAKKRGTYWCVKTKIGAFQLPNALAQDNTLTEGLQRIATRLSRFSPEDQGHLINWGYALTDAAMRKWVLPDPTVAPGVLPDPNSPLG